MVSFDTIHPTSDYVVMSKAPPFISGLIFGQYDTRFSRSVKFVYPDTLIPFESFVTSFFSSSLLLQHLLPS